MNARRRRIHKTGIDIIVLILGLVALWLFLTPMQTNWSIRRQEDNFKTKLDVAQQRMARNSAEAEENLASYDAFHQAKIDTVSYFLDTHPDYARTEMLARQWGLTAFALTDAGGNVVYSTGDAVDLKAPPLDALLAEGKPVTVGTARYYAAPRSGGGYAVGCADFTEEMKTIAALRAPERALETITVGGEGFIFAVNPENGVFSYLPQTSLIGQPTSIIGFDAASVSDGQEGWLRLEGVQYYAMTRRVGDDLFTAVVPEAELAQANGRMVALALAIFAAAMILLVAYALILRRDEDKNPQSAPVYIQLGKNLYFNKTMGSKIRNVAVISLVAIFGLSFYMQTLSALSHQSVISNRKLEAVQEILLDNDARVAALSDEYGQEYAQRARNIAWTLGEDPALVTDEALTQIAHRAQVSALYVFNGDGTVAATNTPYKDFVLSEEEGEQSYPFWSVAKGYKDVYIQEARTDDTPEQNYIQYVGVARADAKGMVQLGVLPQRLKSRLASTELGYVLKNIAVENGGYLFAVNKADGAFAYYPKTKYIGRPASDYGLTAAALRDEFSGYQTVDGVKCFVTCAEHGDTFLYTAVPLESVFGARLPIALAVTGGSLAAILVLCVFLLLTRKMSEPAPARKPEADDGAPKPEPRRFFRLVTPGGEGRVVQSAASRWSGSFAWQERTPEQKLSRLLAWLLGAAALVLAAWTISGEGARQSDSIIAYILRTQWEKTPSIFSLTYILLIGIEVYVICAIARKLILYATRKFGARSETVGRLLDSFIKYASVIGILFYGLNFIGVDSASLMTSAGILALVVGLGAQKLIGDILAGIFIVFEGEFRVGDIVTVGDWTGTVMEIGIRTTKIQSGGSDIKIISNSNVSGVVNKTKQYSYASADIGIEYGESLERVETILDRELPLVKDRLPAIISGPFYKGVAALGDSSVVLTVVAQCQEKDRGQLCRDLNRELKLICDHNNISIPFPQIVINEPVEHEKATHAQKRAAQAFVEEQKELSKDIPATEKT